MNAERDKFIIEVMGECWHVFTGAFCDITCKKCGEDYFDYKLKKENTRNFSTPEGFFKLWEFSRKQNWWINFCRTNFVNEEEPDWGEGDFYVPQHLVNPDKFADRVYAFLRRKNESKC